MFSYRCHLRYLFEKKTVDSQKRIFCDSSVFTVHKISTAYFCCKSSCLEISDVIKQNESEVGSDILLVSDYLYISNVSPEEGGLDQ